MSWESIPALRGKMHFIPLPNLQEPLMEISLKEKGKEEAVPPLLGPSSDFLQSSGAVSTGGTPPGAGRMGLGCGTGQGCVRAVGTEQLGSGCLLPACLGLY